MIAAPAVCLIRADKPVSRKIAASPQHISKFVPVAALVAVVRIGLLLSHRDHREH
jgi:hypothetical protein